MALVLPLLPGKASFAACACLQLAAPAKMSHAAKYKAREVSPAPPSAAQAEGRLPPFDFSEQEYVSRGTEIPAV